MSEHGEGLRRAARVAPYALLALSLLTTAVFAVAIPGIDPLRALPWPVASVLAILALRLGWSRLPDRPGRDRVFFWANAVLTALGALASPLMGLYAFYGYYEVNDLLKGKRERRAGLVCVAAIVAFCQTGGPASEIFTLSILLAFFAVNLGIASLMTFLDGQRQKLLDELRVANRQLLAEREQSAALRDQLFAHAREAGITDERSRLSREIHDTVAQGLVAIITQLEAAADASEPGERDRRIAIADAAARDSLAEARHAVHALASPRLDSADLPLALDDLLGDWRSRSGTDAELRVTGHPVAAPHDAILLRTAQEALSNAARHARASHVDVLLAYTPDTAQLTVTDDGVGFDAATRTSGHGITGMQARASQAGGHVQVRSAPGAGTSIVVSVPLTASAGLQEVEP